MQLDFPPPAKYTCPMFDFAAHYEAVQRRDPALDGVLFVAVRTTGIYCRPVCKVRTPLARNIEFYPSAAAAERAGYRPCLRCRPETAPFCPAWKGTKTTVARALALIEAGALDRDSVDALATSLGIGPRRSPWTHVRLDLAEEIGLLVGGHRRDQACGDLGRHALGDRGPVSLELGMVEHPDRDVERQRADDRRRLVGREGVERLGEVGHRRGERQVRKLTRLGLQQGEEGPPRVQHGHGVWLAPTSALVSTKAIARYTRNPITTTAMARPVVS